MAADKSSNLNPRQQKVMRATVRHYVSTAEPVGSKALLQAFDLNVSAATIRNVMGALERSGFLYQPHTSAGRVPSDSGYRLYVDELIKPSKPTAQRIDRLLSQQVNWQGWSVEALLQEAAQILAHLSGHVALVTLPNFDKMVVKHLQLVQISTDQVLVVLVLDSYGSESMVVKLPRGTTGVSASEDEGSLDRELQILSNFLTAQLCGRPLSEISRLNWDEVDTAEHHVMALCEAIDDLAQRKRQPQTHILVTGVADVLSQPEFAEQSQLRNLVALLADGREQLWPLMCSDDSSPALKIWIGAENPLEPMQGCALISAPYNRDSMPLGSVGVMGPTRMLYENTIAAVEATSSYLSDIMSGLDVSQ
ncbi:heat-inducible transcriptional repressor HrcA [Leptolyngbya cf. ectocarpi LEGE 11479]|uniref:Heat-inducible transcription repressor HrcA n=1 Tax=Leptolyngbya cf. ectocarpi LEGE 11479 TaxID=1828722 RepID=A0A928X1Q5_LEPEC|nr:heat-inducible transcriptional repressor HrcA [Leptolyngbya ectocarpi]MBE9065959.1 heat-inducible transcriptional repressor HrcA [Leptolyngbya cf. ectocarpi LEGE 11479]